MEIVSVPTPRGGQKAAVRNGLDVWEYVLVAQDYEWDVARTAAHLREPEKRVRAALDHYQAHPEEVDEHFRRMREIDANPEAFFPTPPARRA